MNSIWTSVGGTLGATDSSNPVTIFPRGLPVVGVEITGTFVQNLIVEEVIADSGWVTAQVFTAANVSASATPSAPARLFVQAAGRTAIRVRQTGYVSGTATVVLTAGFGALGASGGGGGGASTIADGADVALGTTTDAAIITDTSGTVIGFLRGAIKMWITYLSRFPAALGGTTSAASLPVVLSSDGPFAVQTGSITEAAPATDTASSGLNGRLQRVAQRLTSVIALLPASIGSKAAAGSLGVALATDEPLVGALTEAAPATDTASSGLNGRLQRVAQRISSLIALLPTALISNRLDVNLGAAPATVTANATLQAATVAAGNVGGLTKTISSVLTRPANTTTYTANDEMADTGGTIRTIVGAGTVSGGKGIITHCLLSCSSNGATKPTFTVYVYDTTSTPASDNAAFAPSDGVQDTCIGSFTLTSAEVGDATASSGNFTMDSGQIHIPYTTVGGADLFFRVKVTNGYTPGANSDTNTFRFKVQQDAN